MESSLKLSHSCPIWTASGCLLSCAFECPVRWLGSCYEMFSFRRKLAMWLFSLTLKKMPCLPAAGLPVLSWAMTGLQVNPNSEAKLSVWKVIFRVKTQFMTPLGCDGTAVNGAGPNKGAAALSGAPLQTRGDLCLPGVVGWQWCGNSGSKWQSLVRSEGIANTWNEWVQWRTQTTQ